MHPDESAIVPFAVDAAGVRLAVRLTPRAHRSSIDGIVIGADGRAALRVRLVAPPVERAANTALIAFLAAALGVAKSAVAIRSSDTSRLKILHIGGDPAAIVTRLEGCLSAWLPHPDGAWPMRSP